MTKLKVKIGSFIFLSLVGLAVGFFFSGLLNIALSRTTLDIASLAPQVVFKSLIENEKHRLLLLCTELFIVCGIAVLFLMNKRETFESDVSAVTKAIQTPIAIGQGQHGTARWLKKEEQRKTFSLYRVDADDNIFKSLLDAGEKDRKEVKKYESDQRKAEADNEAAKTNSNPEATSKELSKVEEKQTEKVQ